MENSKEKSKKKERFLHFTFLVPAIFLFVQCASSPSTDYYGADIQPLKTVNSSEIRDYICIVNRHLHPNMERFLNTLIRALIEDADEESDDHARKYEYYKRGGSGSGFVYVDKKGNNYILTNYHVIVGAHRLSVTFENENGARTVYQNLRVVGVDELADLAILGFPHNQKPFRKGIPLAPPVRDDTVVRAAGYPGIPEKPTWNIHRGTVANAVSYPITRDRPYIQHNAAINPGNSGGPLLVEDRRSSLRYSVAGMNTFYIQGLHSAFYAIPSERINAFIQRSLQQTTRDTLENRLAGFMEIIQKSITSDFVFKSLSSYLSSTMINADPLSIAIEFLNEEYEHPILIELQEEILVNPVIGVPWAVALDQIEMPIYRRSNSPMAQKDTQPEIISTESNNMGGYTVKLLVNGYPYKTEWGMEYGSWKLDEFIHDDGEYNDYWDLATVHLLGKKIIYSLSSPLDVDWYELHIPRAGRLTVRTEGNLDTALLLCTDITSPQSIVQTRLDGGNDDRDAGPGLNEIITVNVSAGKVYARVRLASGNPGEYILFAGLDGTIDNVPYHESAAAAVPATQQQQQQQQPNTFNLSPSGSNFTSGTLRPGEVHNYRIYLENDEYYEIVWRDFDSQGNLANPIADIMVGLKKEGASNYLIPVTDDGNQGTNHHQIYRRDNSKTPRFDSNSWYIIEVRGLTTTSGGNYQIRFF